METEVVRIVADWLANLTSAGAGVNALLNSVPLDGGDSAPPPVTVYDATRDNWVARKLLPNDETITLPAVAVFLLAPAQVDGEVGQTVQDGTFSLAIAYLFQKSDTKSGVQAALYTKRAIRQSLNRLHALTTAAAAARVRNNIHLYECTGITLDPTVADWQRSGSTWLATAVLANYKVRDLAP